MENLPNFLQYGPLTAVLAFAMACVGAGLGLRCLIRASDVSGNLRRGWLATAAVAIGSGMWTMHLIAMLGFGVDGSPIRYDVSLTLLSLVIAVGIVGLGIFATGPARSRLYGPVLSGVAVGVGIAAMHYTGMAAMRIHGTMTYDPPLAVLTAVIALGASVVALLVAFRLPNVAGTVVASLILGMGASGAQYTGIAALRVEVTQGTSALPGASAVEFIFPLLVVFGSFLFLSSAFVALSPIKKDRRAAVAAVAAREHDPHLAR